MDPILEYLREHEHEIVDDLRRFVERESPTDDTELIHAFADFLAGYAESAGAAGVQVLDGDGGGRHVRIQLGTPGDHRRPVMLLGHFDTVWPRGTLERRPFELVDGIARGPGVYDMKAGLVGGFWALRALAALRGSLASPVVFLCNCDEEVGSPTSRSLIEAEARDAEAVLVLEPSEGGDLKTARKGVGIFHIEVTGRAAHAGLDPLGGLSAIDELCRFVLELHAQSDHDVGTTFNVGVISGGTRYNVIASAAAADVDLRVRTAAEAERMTEFIQGLKPRNAEVGVEVTGGLRWPPMERSAGTAALFERARGLARELGFDVGEAYSGGASDGNFCAAVGAPVLDGLGAVGGGAHADHEHVLVTHLPARAALVARLVEDLSAGKGEAR